MEENVTQVEKKEKKKLTKKQIIIIAAAAAVVVIAAIIIIAVLANDKLKATTMRIMRLEGTVTLEQNGRVTAVKEDLRLKNGNALITDSDSLVGISLDDFKNITLDELSRAEFIQKGKQLQLNLTEGALFFEVTKPLENDETCEIHTSSMVVGIRGTSGWVRNTKDVEEVILTDGHVKIMIKNPYTGETKEVTAEGGQRVRVSFSQEMKKGTSINVVVEDISEDDLNQFILDRLRENDALRAKVEADTNWSDPIIMGTKKEEPIAKVEDEKQVESEDEDDDDTASAGDDDEDEAPEEEAQWRDLVTIDPNALPEGDQVQPTAETPVVYVEWFPPATEEPAPAPEAQPATDPATDPGTTDPGAGSNSGSSSGGSTGSTTGTITQNADGSMTATLSNGATASYDYEMLRITSGGTGVISLPIRMPDPDGGPNNIEIGLDGIALEDGVGGVNINATGLTDASAQEMQYKISGHPSSSITNTEVATISTNASGATTTNMVVNASDSSNLRDFQNVIADWGMATGPDPTGNVATYGNATISPGVDQAGAASGLVFSGTVTGADGTNTSVSNQTVANVQYDSAGDCVRLKNYDGSTLYIVEKNGTVHPEA